ncbi:S8 family serine peptidase [Kaarinaea lacus]
MNTFLRYIAVTIAAISLISCFHDDDDNGSASRANLSGTITALQGSATDSDVNDVLSPYAPNNTLTEAQLLPNPVTLGGFVTLQGQVFSGRFVNSADVYDYFSITLLSNQVVSLRIADLSSDIDLYLLNSAGTEITQAVTQSLGVKSLVVPDTGDYFLRVQATRGASNYLLNTGLSNLQSAGDSQDNNDLALDREFVPGEVIVRFKNTTLPANQSLSLSSRAAALGLQAKAGAPNRSMLLSLGDEQQRQQALRTLGVTSKFFFSDSKTQLKAQTLDVIKVLRKRADVEYAQPNYINRAFVEPDDTHFPLQWHYPLINLPLAWDETTGDAGVIVAVIDTGILGNHPDLLNKTVAGFDFIRDATNAGDGDGIDSDPTDEGNGLNNGTEVYHGSHVAGTIAAVTNNTSGVAGIGWDVNVMPLRVLGRQGGTDYDIEQAMAYALGLPNDGETQQQTDARVANGLVADVINLSLGRLTISTEAPPIFQEARNRGVIVVAAAGNDSSLDLSFPAAADGVVSVSAVDMQKNRAYYSNYGVTIDVAAPGGDARFDSDGDSYADGVLSTSGDDSTMPLTYNYRFLQGTSMAAPHVAGVAALMKSVDSNMNADDFDTFLTSGAITEDLGDIGRDNFYGYGLIDALLAVQAAGAGVQALDPLPVVTPTTLTFPLGTNQLQFSVRNAGGGELSITTPEDPNGTVDIIAANVDVDTGLGSYTVQVDRLAIPQNPIVGTIVSITYSGMTPDQVAISGTINLPILIYNQTFSANAGTQIAFLVDADTFFSVQYRIIQPNNGIYRYQFSDVRPGRYFIASGTDLDNDGEVCGTGEACGIYNEFGLIADIVVGGSDISGLDFYTGYNLFLGTDDLSAEYSAATNKYLSPTIERQLRPNQASQILR